MSMRRITAIIMIALGIVVLAYSGITLKTPGKPIDLGPIHVQTTQRHFIPPVAGAIVLACGIVLLVVGKRRA